MANVLVKEAPPEIEKELEEALKIKPEDEKWLREQIKSLRLAGLTQESIDACLKNPWPPLLKPEEVIDLAKKMDLHRYVQAYSELPESKDHTPEDRELRNKLNSGEGEPEWNETRLEEARKAAATKSLEKPATRQKIEEEYWKAREKLIIHNLGLVVNTAKKYDGLGLPFIDLVQAGSEGLITAVDSFDYTKGLMFSTHGWWWIRQGITRTLENESKTIRLPVGVQENIRKYNQKENELREKLKRDPKPEEVFKELDWNENQIRTHQLASRPATKIIGYGYRTPTSPETILIQKEVFPELLRLAREHAKKRYKKNANRNEKIIGHWMKEVMENGEWGALPGTVRRHEAETGEKLDEETVRLVVNRFKEYAKSREKPEPASKRF
ncbi:hypothetical protein COU38_02865 [Candidatus Micrarchaeota archaeon CG10_big_fil_rev_8_21_14_0_10_54_18]|nr:MAG: hypothetical protein AUJ15_01410 [Candidatus Micrarchaeota archaeon CG1_02_55_41]PIO03520.1 MAG: hypothetical protein COT57_00650 [Candidatus Micrarchaeota archaeon CG09_land_8_20_14_0_10_55_25]PJD01116.1 MAG: hypothetical protein COU38_02865 [Candidatus Micrarchaeota archaeon CG10_big_fil_rev_8_21_14_0_10_54_18]